MLTVPKLKRLKAKDRDYIVRDKTARRGTGRLLVKVKTSGAKEFYFSYKHEGKQRLLKIGNYDYPKFGLADAREKVKELSRIYAEHGGVKEYLEREERRREEARRLEERAGTFGQLLDVYLAHLKESGRVSADRVEWSFKKYVREPHKDLVAKRANTVTVADVRDILAAMIETGVTTYVNRLRSQLHAAFQFGLKHDYNPRKYLDSAVEFGLEFNPVAGVPVQQDWERVGDRSLTADELRDFWLSLPGDNHPITAAFIKFLFTIGGQRPQQVLRCDWTAYDLDSRLLTIENLKDRNRLALVVPLNDLAVSILEEVKQHSDSRYPFAGIKLGSPKERDKDRPLAAGSVSRSLKEHLKEKGLPPFVLRDIRRTWKTLAGQAGLSKEIRDRIQGHAMSDVSSKHYDRYGYLPEKRQAMDAWDRRLRSILGLSEPGGNVVTLRR